MSSKYLNCFFLLGVSLLVFGCVGHTKNVVRATPESIYTAFDNSRILTVWRGWNIKPNFIEGSGRLNSGIMLTAPNRNQYYLTNFDCDDRSELKLLWKKEGSISKNEDQIDSLMFDAHSLFCQLDSLRIQAIVWDSDSNCEIYSNLGDSTYFQLKANNNSYFDSEMEYNNRFERYGDENYPFVFVRLNDVAEAQQAISSFMQERTIRKIGENVYCFRSYNYSKSSSLELYK